MRRLALAFYVLEKVLDGWTLSDHLLFEGERSMNFPRGKYGPTRECLDPNNCPGCVKCAAVATLIEFVRAGHQGASLELADRVEQLMGDGTIVKGTAGGMVRGRLEPVPKVALDAMDKACEIFHPDA